MAPRILVVEDDEAFRYVVATYLANAGYQVEEAADYHRALEVLQDNEPLDLLVSDVCLSVVNGFTIGRLARQHRPGLQIMFMTGLDELPISEAFGTVIHKPAHPEVIVGTAKRMLDPALAPRSHALAADEAALPVERAAEDMPCPSDRLSFAESD
jgi:CheY-like chemotaxis protein